MFCTGCGQSMHDSAIACPKCGAPTSNFYKNNDKEVGTGIIVAGYILSIVIPLVGFIIGIYTLSRGKQGHGIGMMVISCLAFAIYMAAQM